MTIYSLLARVFPRSFVAKVFLIAFIGTHVPLIATVSFLFKQRGGVMANLDIAGVILVATLAGTAATLLSLRAILSPLFAVRDAMIVFETDGERVELPTRFRDEVGTVMALTDRLMQHVERTLTKTRIAADTDSLTGLFNRRGFDRRVRPTDPGAIVCLDLDHFKSVNDSFGHQAGDDVLRTVADVIRRTMRDDDIVARFGGEEFVVFLPGATAKAAGEIAERARTTIADTVGIGTRTITASFGVAACEDGGTVQDAIERADAASYAAKQGGRNRVVLWRAPAVESDAA